MIARQLTMERDKVSPIIKGVSLRREPSGMKRASFCLLILVLFHALNIQTAAQQPTKSLPKIGVIFSFGTANDTPSPIYQAYIQGLRDLGYVEGKNIILER